MRLDELGIKLSLLKNAKKSRKKGLQKFFKCAIMEKVYSKSCLRPLHKKKEKRGNEVVVYDSEIFFRLFGLTIRSDKDFKDGTAINVDRSDAGDNFLWFR